MDTSILKTELRLQADELGADLCGIAAAASLAAAPEGHRPTDIMPRVQSVIVLARRLPKEVVTNRRLYGLYAKACTTSMNMLDTIALRLACWLEDQGGRALPIPADDPYTEWDAENMRGMGDISHRHAAVAAGLGVLGRNSMLVTPQYGNRVHLVTILTDLYLEPDQPLTEELCPPDCQLCFNACPSSAVNENRQVVQKLCRPQIARELPRGFSVYGCWECRRVCPIGR